MRDLRKLPKAHLHLHFTGSMRPETLHELAAEQRIRLPLTLAGTDRSSLATPHHAGTETRDRGWFRFQRLYDSARKVVTSEAIMRRLLREAALDDIAEGSVRLEIQIDPTSYAPFVGGITPALEILVDEARAIQAETGLSMGIIVAASRMRHPLDARTLARLAVRYSPTVVGFGLSNDERRGVTEQFAPAFTIARDGGLISAPHGGELLGPAHIHTIIDSLRPSRLGHGVRAAEDPALLERIVTEGIGLEVCPASNVSLGVYEDSAAVPLETLAQSGAMIALGADDPLLFGSRLNAQYETARELGMDDSMLANLARGSIQASTMSNDAKQRHLAGIDRWLEAPPAS